MMLNLARVIKPWKEADALSAHINLYGFWTETTFLTKSGDLGMVLSVAGVDYESLDNDEQQYAVKRMESALKAFGEGFHVYQYLFKTNRPDIPFARYDDELIDAAIDQRRQFFESKRDRLYEIKIFYVIVLEGVRSKTGILSALARMPRDPQGGLCAPCGPTHATAERTVFYSGAEPICGVIATRPANRCDCSQSRKRTAVSGRSDTRDRIQATAGGQHRQCRGPALCDLRRIDARHGTDE